MTTNQSAAEKVCHKEPFGGEGLITAITALLDEKDREIAVLWAECKAWREWNDIWIHPGFDKVNAARKATDAMREGRDANK